MDLCIEFLLCCEWQVFGCKDGSPLATWLLNWMSAHLDCEIVQEPWMCHCIYCKDVYVGLLCLRVIYLPKGHYVTLEISGNIYLKYVAFYLSLWWSFRLWTNTGRLFFVFTSAIFQSHPGRTIITAGAQNTQSYKQVVVWIHSRHLLSCFTPHKKVFVSELMWNSLFTTVHCWAFYRTYCTYFSSILQTLWNITGDCFCQSAVGAWRNKIP